MTTNDALPLVSPSAKVTKRVPDLCVGRDNKTFVLSSISFAFSRCIRLPIIDGISVLETVADDDDAVTLQKQG